MYSNYNNFYGGKVNHQNHIDNNSNIITYIIIGVITLLSIIGAWYVWKNYSSATPWEIFYTILLRTNKDGFTECASMDNKNCYQNVADFPNLIANPSSIPSQLTCGAEHKAKWGGTGYEPGTTSWCSAYARTKGKTETELAQLHELALSTNAPKWI